MKNLEKEIWLPVVGFEKSHKVSNTGRVVGLKRVAMHGRYGEMNISEKELVNCVNGSGYFTVTLASGGISKPSLVHRIVAEAFLKNDGKLSDVNHIDGNKLNNVISNLEWCSHSDNQKKAFETNLHSITWNKTIVAIDKSGNERIFSSILLASKVLKIDRRSIQRSLSGNGKFCAGYSCKIVAEKFIDKVNPRIEFSITPL